MNIKQLHARVSNVEDLSESAREVTITLPESIDFMPGAFVNVFIEKEGRRERRAYSISSNATEQKRITLTIRKGSIGGISRCFWEPGIHNAQLSIMGPLGLNTVDRITTSRVFLFGFGIGVSVVKGLTETLLARSDLTELTIVTGNRTEDEILYKDFFGSFHDPRLTVRFVVSRPTDLQYPYRGYIQDHISDFDFSNSTVYLCGQGAACTALREAIELRNPTDVQFLVESFDS